ncbi:MAG: hypothetical protein IJG09_07955 [Methanobrevibacter sp.]|nr:hypothetical protein [Methanobrevibacter sp.]
MIIKISQEINSSLELNTYATNFIEKINSYDELDFVIDFEGVKFVSRTFAQAYYASKKRSPKNISEINLSSDVEPLMKMVEKQIIGV